MKAVVGVAAIVACVVGCACETSSIADGGRDPGGDAGSDAATADGDAGPPPQFCPDDITRRFVDDLPDDSYVSHIQVASTLDTDVIAATTISYSDGTASLGLWAVDRVSGAVTQLAAIPSTIDDASAFVTSMLARDRGISVIAIDSLDATTRVRWEGDDSAPVIDHTTMPPGYWPRLVGRNSTEDTMLVVVTGGPETRLERWSWPVDGAPAGTPVPGDPLAGVSVSYLRPAVAIAGTGEIGLVVSEGGSGVPGTSTAAGRLLWFDPSASRVLSSLDFVSGGVMGGSAALEPLGDEALALMVSEGSTQSIRRATRSGIEPWIATFPGVLGAAGGPAGAFYVSNRSGPPSVDPAASGTGNLQLAHVDPDAPVIEGLGFDVVTGECTFADVTVPPVGGAVAASTCSHQDGIDLTYFCVPGVR